MIWLGSISYSLYLLHVLPMYWMRHFLNQIDLGWELYSLLLAVGTLVLAIPMSWASYRWVEQPFMRKRRPVAVAPAE